MNYQENSEVAKYKKKKDNSSKSNKKSDHKHQYCDCILVDPEHSFAHKGQYCCICGKINEHKRLSLDDYHESFIGVDEGINDLPVFYLKTWIDDYVNLLEANNERN